MSYTFAICNATLPKDRREAKDEVHRFVEEPEPDPAVFEELITRLTRRYPCICDLTPDDDGGPWCSGPLGQKTYNKAHVLGQIFSRVEEVMAFVVKTATGLGLAVLDWQTGEIHRPEGK